MAQDNFIEIGGRFIEPIHPKPVSLYRNDAGFRHFALKDPTSSSGFTQIDLTDCLPHTPNKYNLNTITNRAEQLALCFSNIYHILNFITAFQKNNDKSQLVNPKNLKDIENNFLVLHERKAQFYRTYGHYTLTNKRVLLGAEAVGQVNLIFENLTDYEGAKKSINEAIKKEIGALNALITPFLFEEYWTIDQYGRYLSDVPGLRVPLKSLSFLSPLIPQNGVQNEMFALFKELQSQHESIYALTKSVEEENAQAKLQGYALYFNNKNEGQGFYSNNGLKPSILEARIFHTNEQAKAYVAKNSHLGHNFMVIELDFKFSKIVEQKDCPPGA